MEQRELSQRLQEHPEVSLSTGSEVEVTIRRFTPIQKGRHGAYAVVDRRDDEIVADDLSLDQALTVTDHLLSGLRSTLGNQSVRLAA